MPSIILAARGRITTHFHEDIGRGFLHRGIDQGHGDGNAVDLEIRAPADGVVTFAGPLGSYGNVLFITHDDGWVSVLAHHAKQFVSKGDRVRQRQLVAEMGNTGTVYVHNHQELRDAKGNQVDPLLHLASTAGNTQTNIPEDDMFSDADRALLNSTLAAASKAAQSTNLPVLVKTADSNKVWLSNLVTRRLVNDSIELGNIQISLASRGLDSGVNTVADLDVFGVPVAATL